MYAVTITRRWPDNQTALDAIIGPYDTNKDAEGAAAALDGFADVDGVPTLALPDGSQFIAAVVPVVDATAYAPPV